METSGFRPESHVAQQSRREKLRVQQQQQGALTQYQQNPDNFPNNLEQFNDQIGINPDMVQVRSVRNANWLYEPVVFTSEMLDFSKNGNTSSVAQSQMGTEVSSFSKTGGDPQSIGNWRSVGPQQHDFDWVLNAGSDINHNPVFVRDVSGNISSTSHHLQSTNLTNPSTEQLSCRTQIDPKLGSTMHLSSVPLYHNTLEDVVKASTVNHGIQVSSLETHQSTRENGYGTWMDRTVENQHKYWGGELGYNNGRNKSGEELEELRTVVGECNPQGLCLSLSSNPSSKLPVSNFEGCGSEDLPPRNNSCVFKDYRDHSKAAESEYLGSIPIKPAVINKSGAKSVQEIDGISANAFRSSGPLGPFTGYASILKSSKFLKPAQQLLEDFCYRNGSMPVNICDLSEGISGEEFGLSASASVAASPDVQVIESHVVSKGSNSRASSSPFYGSNEFSGDCVVGSSSEPIRPEFQQKKAKLLYMLEEVCRRYKQYNQQMQLVITPFESVAGLSSATPYISLALKTVSRHFRCLKNAISEQLIHIKRTVGEDLSSPTIGTSIIKGDIGAGRLKYLDQGFQKHKSGGVNVGFFEPQQHIWRPQRGLPERAVSILRAWLFEHFLHPYPTDADKHMLANQTGLSRNQVSNWFINARVRLWKPMVEEIHMLETKGSAEIDQNPSNHNNASEGTNRPSNNNQTSTKHSLMQLESCAAGSSSGNRDVPSIELQNPEKRVRLECQVPTGMSGALDGFVPCQRNGFEVGGLGPVSLTLGLRHGVESAQQQMQQQEDQLRRQFGEQMIRDFAG